MSSHSHYKRRNYFIKKEFQGRYIFHYFVLAALGSILFIGIFSFFSANTLSITYDNYHLQLGVTPGILFKKILSTQWVFIVLGGIIVVFVTLMLTHRLAGPFFRFERTLDAMLSKDLSDKLFLRKKDQGKTLAKKLNNFNHMLGNNLTDMQRYNEKIAVYSRTLQHVLETSPDMDKTLEIAEARALLDEIQKSSQTIQAMVQAYTIPRAEE
ncbi:MAG: methyl-accepting chemotaxis protein [Desulfotignum sp.]|jgi:methyl-accepting chemotaxis protein|nr:methyl-accepting chemotaxis protein [Desulfotignum sp.]